MNTKFLRLFVLNSKMWSYFQTEFKNLSQISDSSQRLWHLSKFPSNRYHTHIQPRRCFASLRVRVGKLQIRSCSAFPPSLKYECNFLVCCVGTLLSKRLRIVTTVTAALVLFLSSATMLEPPKHHTDRDLRSTSVDIFTLPWASTTAMSAPLTGAGHSAFHRTAPAFSERFQRSLSEETCFSLRFSEAEAAVTFPPHIIQ